MNFVIRDYKFEDVVKQREYMNNSSDEFLWSIGFNPHLVKNRILPTKESLEVLFSIPKYQRLNHAYAVDYAGEVLGIVWLKNIVANDKAEVHCHIFNENLRKKGFATSLFYLVLNRIFQDFDLKVLVCEPSDSNIAINSLLQKMNVQVKNQKQIQAEGIVRAFVANVYEIHRDQIEAQVKLNP